MKKFFLFLSVILSVSFLQEDKFISELKARSDSYFVNAARTKLELIFHQPKYVPGDTAFFRTIYVTASDLKPVKGTQMVHVCLFDQFGHKKMEQSLRATNGFASNKLIIPENIKPGNYLLVAFTDWMKNFDKSLFFQRQFLIAGQNSFEKQAAKDSLMFYAEGGSLVAGINNNLAIRYTGSKPKAKAILKSTGKEITSLTLVRDSVTVFSLKPDVNEVLVAELVTENGSKKFSLPKVAPSGVAIFTELMDRRLKLNLELSGNEMSDLQLYLLAFNNKGLAFHSPLKFSSDRKRTITIPQNLPEGIMQTVVVDSKMNIWASRVIHLGATQNITAKFDNVPASYPSRHLVKLKIQAINDEGYGADGAFACRVINGDLFESQSAGMDYISFSSDISNTFELNRKDANIIAINNYLITQTCPWFDWKKINDAKPQLPVYKANSYLTFSGKATYAKNGLPVKDSTLIMFFLENNLRGYETYADAKGYFAFPLVLSIFSNDQFFYTASYKGKDADEIKLKIDDPDSLISFCAEPWVATDVADSYTAYSMKRKSINNSYSFFVNPKVMRDSTFDPNKSMEVELYGADIVLNLKDYLLMPTMEDVSKELLRGVEYRKINGRHVVRVNTTGKVPNNYAGPLYVIDGQVTKDPTYFLGLNPADVVSINVVKDSQKLIALGKLGANGVILVRTKSQATINEKNKINFSGLLPAFSNYSRTNSGKNLPDLRSCLFWSPMVHATSGGPSEIQFTTSDDIGNFRLQIYGLTESGLPIFVEKDFEVKYSGN